MGIASARLALFEAGEIDLDEACEGMFDRWLFRAECERADAATKKRPIDRKTERLRNLLDSNWSLEAVCRAVNSHTVRVRAEAAA
jgi:hypothetical protein